MNEEWKQYVEALTPEEKDSLYNQICISSREVLHDANMDKYDRVLLLYQIREYQIILERALGHPVRPEASDMNLLNCVRMLEG